MMTFWYSPATVTSRRMYSLSLHWSEKISTMARQCSRAEAISSSKGWPGAMLRGAIHKECPGVPVADDLHRGRPVFADMADEQ